MRSFQKRDLHKNHIRKPYQAGDGKITDALKKVGARTRDAALWTLHNMKELATHPQRTCVAKR